MVMISGFHPEDRGSIPRIGTPGSKPWEIQETTCLNTLAAMAEWFKAADLRPAIIDAWVRTPLAANTPLEKV